MSAPLFRAASQRTILTRHSESQPPPRIFPSSRPRAVPCTCSSFLSRTRLREISMSGGNRTSVAGRIGPATGGDMTRTADGSLRMVRLALALAVLLSAGEAAAEERELRVCADPDNLPFSNERLEGFENNIAELIANELDASLRYTWASQRRGFIRQTLKAGKCDLVMGVPSGYEMVLSTKPYYRSTYVFVYAKSKKLELRSFDDPVLRRLKVGLHAFGEDGANSPPAHALARCGIARNVIGFTILNTEESPPGKIIDAVAAGEIDVAIVWGPFAGYFAKRERAELEVVPVSSSTDLPFLRFVYDMSMGVRRGEDALKEQLEGVLDRRRGDIQRILEAYGIPLVGVAPLGSRPDRKSTRLNSSHVKISYAVFCLKKKKKNESISEVNKNMKIKKERIR